MYVEIPIPVNVSLVSSGEPSLGISRGLAPVPTNDRVGGATGVRLGAGGVRADHSSSVYLGRVARRKRASDTAPRLEPPPTAHAYDFIRDE